MYAHAYLCAGIPKLAQYGARETAAIAPRRPAGENVLYPVGGFREEDGEGCGSQGESDCHRHRLPVSTRGTTPPASPAPAREDAPPPSSASETSSPPTRSTPTAHPTSRSASVTTVEPSPPPSPESSPTSAALEST